MLNQQLVQQKVEAPAVARTDVNVGVTGRWGDIKWRSTMYTNPQCR